MKTKSYGTSIDKKWFTKRIKKKDIDMSIYKTKCVELNQKIDVYAEDIKNGFAFWNPTTLKKFIQGYKEFDNFSLQFVKLQIYNNQCEHPTANTLEKSILLYGPTLGLEKYNNLKKFKSGSQNPGYQHGGTLSPWSDKSTKHSKETRNIARQKTLETKKDPSRRGNRNIEYWVKRGMSPTEAVQKVKELQNTFSLKICKEKHGSNGYNVWKARQEKWQNTLSNKSQEVKDDINRRKSSGCGNIRNKNVPCILYYVYIFNDDIAFWKIGITTRSVEHRLKLNTLNARTGLNHKILFANNVATVTEAFEQEQFILSVFTEYRTSIKYKGFNTTEAFNVDVLKKYYEIITN